MSDIVKINDIEPKIQFIRNQKVILDYDVALLYGVETKRVNEAVKNNPEKFPFGYVIELNNEEYADLRSKFSTTNFAKVRTHPKAFTEKGLYMLATILKSQVATQTTINIIETFTKLREFTQTVSNLAVTKEEKAQKSLLKQSSELMSEILGYENDIAETETSIELNFAVLKFKHTVKRKNDKNEVHEEEPVYIKLKNISLNNTED